MSEIRGACRGTQKEGLWQDQLPVQHLGPTKQGRKKGQGWQEVALPGVSSSPMCWLSLEKGAWLRESLGVVSPGQENPPEGLRNPPKARKLKGLQWGDLTRQHQLRPANTSYAPPAPATPRQRL